ncbi:hypothetical protein V2A60_004950 [Cordyceps javanica]
MAQPASEDPFLWDTDRVCEELCFDGAEWTDDASVLESLLRENLMDGETLLTYELTFSRKELMECLGIAAARHRAKLVKKIMGLQRQSPKFHEEKSCMAIDDVRESSPQVPKPLIPVIPPRSAPASVPLAPVQTDSATLQEPKTLDEHPSKRRRLVPTLVTDIQPGTPVPRMPGFEEPDPRTARQTRVISAASSVEDLSTAYLGKKAVAEDSILPVEANYDSDSGSETFSSVKTLSQPRGKTKAIYSLVKRYFRKNNRKVLKIQAGIKTITSSDEGSDIVDFDDLASLDEDTLREIAEEEEENKNANSSSLNSEQVEEIINEEIAKIRTQWESKKLPKYERKAYRLWTYAKKHGFLRTRAFYALRQARHYQNRLSALTADLRKLPWKAPEELRFQAHSVEQTVVDKLHQEWLSNLFSLRSAPPKPSPTRTHKQDSSQTKPFIHDEELSSSSEEEILNDFIVDDEPAFARADSASSPLAALSPGASHHPSLAQPNQSSASSPGSPTSMPAASQPDSFIDLTMASDVEMEDAEEKMVPRTFDPFTQDVLAEIGSTSPKVWAQQNDRFRLAISILWRLEFERREAIFRYLAGPEIFKLWSNLVDKAHERRVAAGQPSIDAVFDLTLVFLSFLRCKYYKERKLSNMTVKDLDKLEDSERSFPPFCGFLTSIKDAFPQKNQIAHLGDDDEELDELDGLPADAASDLTKARKPKKKQIILNQNAVELRERATRDLEEQERRRNELRAAMRNTSTYGAGSAQSPRFIINETKSADEGFIYVHPEISPRIKDHQIEGVRFLWSNIVRDQSVRQGCLLAHTMGLGKTMQTITFLVALRESALSDDPTIRSQIPRDLRDWKVLVLCPAGLVENWRDEFLLWAPKHLVDNILTIEAAQSPYERMENAEDWATKGGVLIIGYTMFKSGFKKGDENAVTIDQILVENATVVVADEAHTLKNPKAKISRVAAELKTSTRIALTGSPLANNVEEYYAMINWVAPNFLGPLQEFRDLYATPIHQGLWHDSTTREKRQAIKLLQVLKKTAAPKVHRATIKSCLKDELPPKEEFVISVPPTQMQRQLYDLYMRASHNNGTKVDQANLFGVLNHLALICAHPAAYRKSVIDINTKAKLGQEVAKFPMDTIPRILKITEGNKSERTELSYKVELLNKILDLCERLGDKVLVFSQSIPTLNYLSNLFKRTNRRYCRLDGSTQISKRQDMVKSFNTGSEMVYLISTNAGGVGLNIHGANRVVIFDFKWNPVQDQQAVGRAYRIGQTKPVFVYRFVVGGSFEDDLQNKAVFKMQLASRVVDQKNVVSWSKRLANLMHTIKDVDATAARFRFKGKDDILDHLLDYDNSRAILSIMSSDTFEEEDETETLTAEEQQEANSMVDRHNLRMTDPVEYNRLMESERIASNQRPASHFASGKPNKDYLPERPSHAFATTSLPSHVTPPAPVLAVPTGSSGPMPILGANTYYGNSSGPVGAPAPPPVLRSNGSTPFDERTRGESRGQFQRKLAAGLALVKARCPNSQFDAASKAASITAEIQAAQTAHNRGLMADTVRWNMLASKVENQKLLLAIAAGQISGSFMGGLADDDSMYARFQRLEDLPDEHFLEYIEMGGKPKDPEVRGTEQERALN